jgi:hypothetical protein
MMVSFQLKYKDSTPKNPKINTVSTRDELEFPKLSVTSLVDKRVSALKFAKTKVSALTQLVVETNDSGNPFGRDFSFFVIFIFIL